MSLNSAKLSREVPGKWSRVAISKRVAQNGNSSIPEYGARLALSAERLQQNASRGDSLAGQIKTAASFEAAATSSTR